MKNYKKLMVFGLSIALIVSVFAGCGKKEEETKEAQTTEAETAGIRKILVGYASDNFPVAYQDEDGNFTGYELEVLKAADEKLADYEFEFVEAGSDALFAGLETGKYDAVVTNSFYTDERAEKFILTENPIGAAVVGIVLKSDVEDINDLSDAATAGLSPAPVLAGDGLYHTMDAYNQANPDNTIEINVSDSNDAFIEGIGWVTEGRYDFAVWPKAVWEGLVAGEDGPLHEYYDGLQFSECESVYTYPVIAQGEDEFADALNTVLGELYADGSMKQFSEEFYGYNVFEYLE